MHYAGFWRRLGAMLLDLCIIFPYAAVQLWLCYRYRLFHLYLLLPGVLFALWYQVYLVARYGGTPGKLICGLRIAMVDGSPVTMRAAFMRNVVQFVLIWISSVASALGVLALTDAQWHSFGVLQQARELERVSPSWRAPVQIIFSIWLNSDVIVLLTNRRRRALHDFIAGTVVLVRQRDEAGDITVGNGNGELAVSAS